MSSPEINRKAYAKMFRHFAEVYDIDGEGDREWLLKEADALDPQTMGIEEAIELVDAAWGWQQPAGTKEAAAWAAIVAHYEARDQDKQHKQPERTPDKSWYVTEPAPTRTGELVTRWTYNERRAAVSLLDAVAEDGKDIKVNDRFVFMTGSDFGDGLRSILRRVVRP